MSYLRFEEQNQRILAHAWRLEHIQQRGMLLVIATLHLTCNLTVSPELIELRLRHVATIETGHTLQTLDGSIDIVAGDQPLGTLLYHKIEENHQQDGQ